MLQGRLRGARARAASGCCKLDLLDLRQKHPARARTCGRYEHILPLIYRVLGASDTGIGSGIDESHFFLSDDVHTRHAGALRGRAQAPGRSRGERRPRRATKVWVTVPTLDEVENIEHARAPHPRRPCPTRTSSSSTTAAPTAPPTRPRRSAPSSAASRCCAGRSKMGLGSAYRAGHAIGIARGYDVMIQIDADLSHDPAALPELLAAVERGADLAIGSRYVPGGQVPELAQAAAAALGLGQPLRRVRARARRARLHRGLPRVPRVDPARDEHRVDALHRLRASRSR